MVNLKYFQHFDFPTNLSKHAYLLVPIALFLPLLGPNELAEFPPKFEVGDGAVDEEAATATAAAAAAGVAVAAQNSCPTAAADAAAVNPLSKDSVWL